MGAINLGRQRTKRRGIFCQSWRSLTIILLLLLGAGATLQLSGFDNLFGSRTSTFGLCGWAYRQNCVIDGDTIRFKGVKIRLADIDAPEINHPGCSSELALGQRAKVRLLELINAGPIQLIQRGGRDADQYGRKLRVVYGHGRSLGEILIAEGLARPWVGRRYSWCG